MKQQEMEIHNLLDAKSRAELREWLMQNHKKETECWVVVKRGRPVDDDTFWYIDAVEEALDVDAAEILVFPVIVQGTDMGAF